jgi:hypothetical protein
MTLHLSPFAEQEFLLDESPEHSDIQTISEVKSEQVAAASISEVISSYILCVSGEQITNGRHQEYGRESNEDTFENITPCVTAGLKQELQKLQDINPKTTATLP